MKNINLDILWEGLPAVSKSVGRYLSEAGAYCLEREEHKSGVVLSLKGSFKEEYTVKWSTIITAQVKRSWNDMEEATEYGAVAVALTMVSPLLNMEVVLRSRKGDGVDYWLGGLTDSKEPLLLAGLEISGIAKASKKNSIKGRVAEKKRRIKN